MESIQLPDNAILVSFDVTALYTNIYPKPKVLTKFDRTTTNITAIANRSLPKHLEL